MSEVTEEGLALLDDRGLREYARSSLNAARIFLEEEARVVQKDEERNERQTRRSRREREVAAQMERVAAEAEEEEALEAAENEVVSDVAPQEEEVEFLVAAGSQDLAGDEEE